MSSHIIDLYRDLLQKRPIHSLTLDDGSVYATPSLNSDTRFKQHLPTIRSHELTGLSPSQSLPESWDWRRPHPDDSDRIQRIKANLFPPKNQMLCSSCWAEAISTSLSDRFVISGLLPFNPRLSTTSVLIRFPESQCDGGNAAHAVSEMFKKGGITDQTCVDYSWCTENCSGTATKHFDAGEMNQMIPKDGCYQARDYFEYTIQEPQFLELHDDTLIDTFRDQVKRHLYQHGPIIAGYNVLANFVNGHFTKLNKGVYLENIDYETMQYNTSSPFVGGHSIVVVGWGLEKGVPVSLDEKKDIPYWYCRNSWTDKWGDGGYFKMAMYPFNKSTCLEKVVSVIDAQGNKHETGGFIILSPKSFQKVPQTFNGFTGKKLQTDAFYNQTPDDLVKHPLVVVEGKKRGMVWVIGGVVVVVLVMGLLFYGRRLK